MVLRARAAVVMAIALLSAPAVATTVRIVPGSGFTDATPAAPVGGNSGTTVGQQRLIAASYAAALWATRLVSTVEIRIEVSFSALTCSPTQGVLGAAGSNAYVRDFTGAPLAGTWYPIALTNALTGVDQCPPASDCTAMGFDSDDIGAVFQSNLGTSGCLSNTQWYYGLDANPGPKQFDFLTVALHEFAHGLGFSTLVNLSSGATGQGFDDAYMLNLEDHSSGTTWPDMSNAARALSGTDTGDLHWVGENVIAAGTFLTAGRHLPTGHVEMYAPNPLESGSSVAHFSTSLAPNELMEPFISGATHDLTLTAALLRDLGWNAPSCGNLLIDNGEECDDGNGDPADGCTNACTICGNGSVRSPEQCDDGNLVDGDGCDAHCVFSGSLPPVDYASSASGKTDSASVNCQKTVAATVRKFLDTKRSLLSKCLDALQEHKARVAAALPADQIGAALAAARLVCVEPSSTAPDELTLIGRIARARAKTIATIEKKCGPPGGTTIEGGPIASAASNDFTQGEIVAHVDRAGCEVETVVGQGYRGAANDLGTFSARASQGAQPLDHYLPCIGAEDLPALDYSPVNGKKDSASVACQTAVATAVRQLVKTKYDLLSKCLNAIQEYKARQEAGALASVIQSGLDAAQRACVEPSAAAPDGKTMLGRIDAAATQATANMELKCGSPGGTTLNGKSIGASASGDLGRTLIVTHLQNAGCSVERLLGLAYFGAATDLAGFGSRTSQGGLPLNQLLPCVP